MSRARAASSPARSIRGSGRARRSRQAGGGGHGNDGLGLPAQRPVEARQHRAAPLPAGEAAGQRRARQAVHRADGDESQAAQQPSVLGREPERFDRETRERRAGLAGGGDACVRAAVIRRAEARQCPGGAGRVGEAEAGLDAEAREPCRDLAHERRLAAEEVGAAADVQQQPVVAAGLALAFVGVHRTPGGEAVAPEREPLQPPPVRLRLGGRGDEACKQGAGVGKAHAGAEARRAGLAVDRPQHRPAPARRHQREGARRGLFVAHGDRPAAGACRESAAFAAGRGRGLSRVRQGRTRSGYLSRRARGAGAVPRPPVQPLAA